MIRVELDRATARLDRRLVLDGVSLALAAGELVALCGPNGAGKSSVIRAALGLLPLTEGETRLGGARADTLSAAARAERVAYLPQERRIAWNMPAVEVAALGAPLRAGPEALDRARAALAEMGAGVLADRGVAEMSGGERARVLLARALVADAPALLADEPVAGLDPDAQLLVLERLKARTGQGGAVLVSLHDLTLAARFADRVVVIDRGRIVADAAPLDALDAEVLRRVFAVHGGWRDGTNGPLLDAVRVQ